MRADSLVVDNWIEVGKREHAERDKEIAALFDQHYDGLCDLAFMIMGDRHFAEEIVMEALMKVFTGWGRIRDKARSDVYLKRAVVNLCRSKIRRKMIEARSNAVVYRREERKAPDWDPEVHETSRQVWEAVKLLPPRQRATIVLHYVHALPESEISEILDCSVGTVRSQLSRARGKLAHMLDPSVQGATG
ncbi:MAG TPA: SigE family RNA polymerase sigma factor [Actinomycetota bacterium]|nr:SigE family RNA polymerase sigma factor [Actinomycetota bacterium]